MAKRARLGWIIAISVLLGAGVACLLFMVDLRKLPDYLGSMGIYGMVLGILLVFFQTFFPFVPFVLLAGANIAIFGLLWGFIVNYVMASLGATAAFVLARRMGHAWVERKLRRYPAIVNFNRKVEEHGFEYTLFGRLIPIIPSSVISVAAGVTDIRLRSYLLGTWIGKIPIVLLESMIAHDVIYFREHRIRLIVLTLAFVALLAVGHFVKLGMSQRQNK